MVQSRVHANVKANTEMIKTVAGTWKICRSARTKVSPLFQVGILLIALFLANPRKLPIRDSPKASDRIGG